MTKYLIPLLLVSTVATAQETPSRCASGEKIFSYLSQQYGEIAFAEFLDPQDRHMVMLVSPKTSTWTVLLDNGNDVFCGMASGTKFEPADAKKFEKYLDKKPEIPG
jgi:hypothetical protein